MSKDRKGTVGELPRIWHSWPSRAAHRLGLHKAGLERHIMWQPRARGKQLSTVIILISEEIQQFTHMLTEGHCCRIQDAGDTLEEMLRVSVFSHSATDQWKQCHERAGTGLHFWAGSLQSSGQAQDSQLRD